MSQLLSLAMMPLAAAAAQADETPVWRIYVGTYAQGEDRGIYLLELDVRTGHLGALGRACETDSPSFLAIHPSKPVLYAVGEAGQPHGTVSAFQMDGQSGLLTLLNQQSSRGTAPCHLSVAPSGRHLAVANYMGGSVALFPISEDGRLGGPSAFMQHEGSGPNAARQEAPHAHSVNFDVTGQYLFAADLGIDQLLIYRYEEASCALSPNAPASVSLAPGAGPRHFTFHPSARFAYVVNELDSTVTAFAHDAADGSLATVQTVSTLPGDFDGDSTTAEILVHRSGRFLYASNRGHDSIAAFAIDEDTGHLTPLGHTPSGGKCPRNFRMDPSGSFLLTANQQSDSVVVFRIDAETGSLTPAGEQARVPAPVCLLFSRLP